MYQVDFTKPCHVHFIGIGGISMSGLAEILNKEGFKVTGSDMKESETTKILADKGIKIYIGQYGTNITSEGDIDLVVYTAAIASDNEELLMAKERNIPLLTRAELLGQIMENYKYSIAVSGTHGKTTTTSMLSHIFMAASKDPTISIGGMLNLIGGNIRVGSSPYFITEACEYTNSFHSFYPFISIILNIDNDHLDFFKNIENIVKSFAKYSTNLKDKGLLVVNGDMKYLDDIKNAVKDKDCKIITFGLNDGNDYQAKNVTLNEEGHPTYDLYINGEYVDKIELAVTGIHNAVNSLSTIAAASFLDLDLSIIKEGLKNCVSAHRRFEYKGTLPGNIKIIDDYAHHPTEIAATLKVGRSVVKNELWCAFQPHTYSRTKALLSDFAKALSVCDHVLLADIYAAREKDDGTISSKDLERELKALGCDAVYLGDFESIKNYFKTHVNNNDMLITMGAGNIDSIGVELLK
ncbi:MAG: UDP-N-acetylmuramate--L-alanine ligase [Eubacterium sp.]|nr:UDP-N-acetylmuramate--L-alanine ligase [Eubacterium sp.]